MHDAASFCGSPTSANTENNFRQCSITADGVLLNRSDDVTSLIIVSKVGEDLTCFDSIPLENNNTANVPSVPWSKDCKSAYH